MPDNTQGRLQRLILSANELREMTQWPDALIEDYLSILEDLLLLANIIDGLKLEDLKTDFQDNSIVFVKDGAAQEDNPDFTWNIDSKKFTVNGTIAGRNRAKQYFYGGF